jgi:hypothetical protein
MSHISISILLFRFLFVLKYSFFIRNFGFNFAGDGNVMRFFRKVMRMLIPPTDSDFGYSEKAMGFWEEMRWI